MSPRIENGRAFVQPRSLPVEAPRLSALPPPLSGARPGACRDCFETQGTAPRHRLFQLPAEPPRTTEGQAIAAVNAQYQRLLGRDADGEGLATFSAKIREMTAAGASFEDIQQAIEQDIMASAEYQALQAPPASPTPGVGSQAPSTAPADLQGITPSQIHDAAGFSDQWSLCGPIAAVAAGRALGKDISLAQAREVALNGGNYSPGDGMKGPESEVRLLKDLGIAAHTESPVNWDKVKEQVQSGRPVILSTPNHYFVVEGYNAQTGKFDLGNSALAMKASGGTQTELSPSEIANWGGGAPTAIILD